MKNVNKVILTGRLTRDPEIRYSGGESTIAVARYTLAVARLDRSHENGETDFFPCVAFGKNAEVAERYFSKGMKIVVAGHLRSGSYTNKDGYKVYTTDIVVENQEFMGSLGQKNSAEEATGMPEAAPGGWSDIPGDMEDLPFN